METSEKIKSFIVGQTFRPDDPACAQTFTNDFKELILAPESGREITIYNVRRKLKNYLLTTSMNDTAIKQKTKSKPMAMEDYWCVRYLLIVAPVLGMDLTGCTVAENDTVYIMHVMLGDGKEFAVSLEGDHDDGWLSKVYPLDGDSEWGEGCHFIYFDPA